MRWLFVLVQLGLPLRRMKNSGGDIAREHSESECVPSTESQAGPSVFQPLSGVIAVIDCTKCS